MTRYDRILRRGSLVTGSGLRAADIAIEGGRIADVGPDLTGECREEIDARGLTVFPGLVDAHVHFNEPGRAEWEGFETGSRALAAGGATAFLDMPLNSSPPTVDAAAFDAKRAAAERASLVDFGLWGGIVPGDLDRLDALHARGAVGFKAFMSASGISDFPLVDDLSLFEAMKRAAKLGALVGLHAENDTMTRELARRAVEAGRTSARDFLRSRPVIAELEAIARAVVLAGETGCRTHIVHCSSGRGVRLVEQAHARGVDITCETCPHYLVLDEEDVEALGAVAKCAPPVRSAAERELLWQQLAGGAIPIVASDHSPAPRELKAAGSFFEAWGGISGCQSLLALLVTEGSERRGLALERIAAAASEQPAARFELERKGRIAPGADADLALVDLAASAVLEADDLFYRHRHSPYVGRRLRGRVVRTLVRGETVFHEGRVVSPPIGRLLRPRGLARQPCA